jgi:deoxyribodipyrimidine photo-lyase
VFTPFWRACLARGEPPPPLPRPRTLRSPRRWPRSEPLISLRLEPKIHKIDWTQGIRAAWTPGEEGARRRLAAFLRRGIARYAEDRDYPARPSSRLSPHLHFGELGPRQLWHALPDDAGAFRRELGWREFAYHVLHHFPHTPDEPLRPEFAAFPWARAPGHLRAWQRGRTGYPIVDAGMRELWATGYLPNRVRMIVASFLVKDLLQDWRAGARWFWDTLVDADLANNTMGWQWTAGSGADAAPYFRVFNPLLQARKLDPEGRYVARWVPELAAGGDYPEPIVDHAEARARALAAFAEIRR